MTIQYDDFDCHIIPIVLTSSNNIPLKRAHVIEKNKKIKFLNDVANSTVHVNNQTISGQSTNNTQNLYVEYLIVLDKSVYSKYLKLFTQLGQLDKRTILQYLRIQYSHYANAVII